MLPLSTKGWCNPEYGYPIDTCAHTRTPACTDEQTDGVHHTQIYTKVIFNRVGQLHSLPWCTGVAVCDTARSKRTL